MAKSQPALSTLRMRILLLVLMLFVGAVCFVVPVYAQTISISNLQYPSAIVVNKQLTVSFTISYSGANSQDYVAAGIFLSPQSSYANGNVISSTPQTCQPDTTNSYDAFCQFKAGDNQGSEDVVFSLSDTSTGTSSFYVIAILRYSSTACSSTSNLCVDAYSGNEPFSVSIIDKFTLSISAPSQVMVTLDGVQQGAGSTALQLSPGMHSISVPDIVQLDSTSRLKFNGWSDGSTQLTRIFDLESDTDIAATYLTQYLVNATSDSTLQSGWYDQGTVLKLNVSNQLVNNYRLVLAGFDGWYNGAQLISKSPSASLAVEGPVTLSARWNYLPYLPPMLIIVAVAAVLFFARRGSIPAPRLPELKMFSRKRTRKRTKRSKPKVETVAPEPESQVAQTAVVKEVKPPKPAKTTMYCTQCGAVISRDSKFCKECGSKQT